MPEDISGSVRQAASLTSLSETYIRDAIYRGELPARKVGNRVVIVFDDLRKWIESHDRVAS